VKSSRVCRLGSASQPRCPHGRQSPRRPRPAHIFPVEGHDGVAARPRLERDAGLINELQRRPLKSGAGEANPMESLRLEDGTLCRVRFEQVRKTFQPWREVRRWKLLRQLGSDHSRTANSFLVLVVRGAAKSHRCRADPGRIGNPSSGEVRGDGVTGLRRPSERGDGVPELASIPLQRSGTSARPAAQRPLSRRKLLPGACIRLSIASCPRGPEIPSPLEEAISRRIATGPNTRALHPCSIDCRRSLSAARSNGWRWSGDRPASRSFF